MDPATRHRRSTGRLPGAVGYLAEELVLYGPDGEDIEDLYDAREVRARKKFGGLLLDLTESEAARLDGMLCSVMESAARGRDDEGVFRSGLLHVAFMAGRGGTTESQMSSINAALDRLEGERGDGRITLAAVSAAIHGKITSWQMSVVRGSG